MKSVRKALLIMFFIGSLITSCDYSDAEEILSEDIDQNVVILENGQGSGGTGTTPPPGQ